MATRQKPGPSPLANKRSSIWSPLYQVRKLSARFLSKETIHNPAFRNAEQPYSTSLLQAVRIKGTILPSIAPIVLVVFLESVIVAILFQVYKLPINLDDRMISMMGSAIAMLLAFRTNRSFERYNQGSQLWTNLATQIRHSARYIWTAINSQTEEGRLEKTRIMKLLLATAVATKHALRGVDPYNFNDLNQLLPDEFVTGGRLTPRLKKMVAIGSAPSLMSSSASIDEAFGATDKTGKRKTMAMDQIPQLPPKISGEPVGVSPSHPEHTAAFSHFSSSPPKSIPPQTKNHRYSLTGAAPPRMASRRTSISNFNHRPLPASLQRKCVGNVINVPLDILHHIVHYVRTQRTVGAIAPEDATPTLAAINVAIDSVTKFEQILYFPVPATYEVHIKQVLGLYFILLPFQLVKPLAMILATFIMCITFFGTDAIAGEIADPFGDDENDLPLDYFCFKLQDDIEYIMDTQFDISLQCSSSEDEGDLEDPDRGFNGNGIDSKWNRSSKLADTEPDGNTANGMKLRKRK